MTNDKPQTVLERQIAGLSALLQLQADARESVSLEALEFLIVNATRQVMRYDQAIYWRFDALKRPRIRAVSGVSLIDGSAPYIRWVEELLGNMASVAETGPISMNEVSSALHVGWQEWLPEQIFWLPLFSAERTGGLILLRRDPWTEGEATIAKHLSGAFGQAVLAHGAIAEPLASRLLDKIRDKKLWVGGAVALLLVMAFPVDLTILAPAEIIPVKPHMVAAPLDGVIKTFHVRPNEVVEKGTALFSLDDTNMRNRRNVAAKALSVAEAELANSANRAFLDSAAKSQLAALAAQAKEKQAELAYYDELLAMVEVKAERPGVAVFADANDWIGKPIQIGERILQIADPKQVEIRLDIPVHDMIALPDKAKLRLFLDIAPLAAMEGRISYVSYEALPTREGPPAYLARADIASGGAPPRIGAKGVARVTGPSVSLFYYLFRRPLIALRQIVGF
jgi:hypothetical protein